MWQTRLIKGITFLLLLFLCWLAFYTGTFPLTKLTPLWGRMGYFDWPVFIDAATHFIETGILYYPDLERYAPNASVYKFPPLFASSLILLLRAGLEPETLRLLVGSLQLLMYLASIWFCWYLSRARLSFFLGAGIFLFVATFEPFINNFIGLQLEAFILFLLCLFLWCLLERKSCMAGVLLGLAIALKLYPVFLVFMAVYSGQRTRFFQGLLVGLVASLAFTTAMIGINQNWFYFTRIAPTLAMEILDTDLRNISISNLLVQLGIPIRYAIYAGPGLLLTAAALMFTRRHLTPHPRLLMAALALLVSALVLGVKNSWGNYQLLLVLPVILLFAESINHPKKDYLSLVCVSIACSLVFFSPPHRLYFVCEILFGLKEIPIVLLFVGMRAVAGLIIFLLSVRFFSQVAAATPKS